MPDKQPVPVKQGQRAPRPTAADQRLAATTLPHFAVSMTTRCQQRCVFCFEGEREEKRWDVDPDVVRQRIAEASRVVPGVVFMGAESTLHPSFLDLVRYTTDLGLRVSVSTNLHRFADEAFLRAAIDAGLETSEFSFHYPDAAVFETITRTPAKRFDRLLRAMANVEEVAAGASAGPGDMPAFAVNVNIVVHALNADRLDEVVDVVHRQMPTAFRLATFKRLETVTLTSSRRAIDRRWVPDGEHVRDGLASVLSHWPAQNALPVLRGFPLCVAPGFEEHHADLAYHGRETPLAQNFGPLDEFSPMYEYDAGSGAVATVRDCERCSLVNLCHAVTRGSLCLCVPGLEPRPSHIDPKDMLESAGVEPDAAEQLIRRSREERASRKERSGSGVLLDPEKVSKVLRLAFARVGGRFGGPTLEHASRHALDGWGTAIGLEVGLGGQVLLLWLVAHRPGAECFEAGKRFMLVHEANTPLDTRQKQDVARVVLRVMERAFGNE